MRVSGELPRRLLVEADLFLSYLTEDELSPFFGVVVVEAGKGKVELLASSEVYDDLISALRSQGVSLEEITNFLSDCRTISHRSLPVSIDIAERALRTYLKHGGPRKLHYFDSYHVATAWYHKLILLTSDRYIIDHATELGVSVLDVRAVGKS